MEGVIDTFFKTVKDYIFPVFCLGCKREGEWVCEKCFGSIDFSGQFFCPVCHQEEKEGMVCTKCVGRSFISKHVAIAKYQENELIGHIIHTLKYQYAEDILPMWKKIIETFFDQHKHLFSDFDLIVPVPLHKKRWAKRGFNQAEFIANFVGENTGLKVLSYVLIRRVNTSHQAKLSREERLTNLVSAFFIKDPANIIGKKIVLVDDVFTTGSTIQECAKSLMENGASEVVGFSIARG
ncbi:MAG: hypothetical protein COX81_03090 [Candidatus Magasanikbacteria bacterium CG_4_10_14_0_2_um_filter_37_12]|uniref:Phosphoribosyltransferase domain-containing protein n=1 Tax=Candidatus Magasanikbacteria bacterium CG_4_10_14_0_2_um_filter_37_12 TaxID=1974637 RepID=A0A2M7V7A1_9BACT|nr:MAG: hypothetical protein COX81_03090 [Candidatus Magasanikbacteria bacterium CG_4_10_14_0_2_um_filter_37_12]